MAGTRKKPATKKASAKKPAVSIEIVDNGDGTFHYVARDVDGKQVSKGAEGSRNRFFPIRAARSEYPELPVQ